MHRILVMSDSHGMNENVKAAIEKTRAKFGPFQYLIHLGDVGSDWRGIESLSGAVCYFVRGNTDYDSRLRDHSVIHIGEHMIFLAHGHQYGVSFGVSNLRYTALENECDIAMYGHTHIPFLEEAPEDVTILNPGSVSLPRQEKREKTFVVMEIDDDGEVRFEFCHL